MECSECYGSGECRHCDGTGDGSWLDPHPSPHLIHENGDVDCPICNGDGCCVECDGSGEIEDDED